MNRLYQIAAYASRKASNRWIEQRIRSVTEGGSSIALYESYDADREQHKLTVNGAIVTSLSFANSGQETGQPVSYSPGKTNIFRSTPR